jgi:hypothetical protein
MRGYEKWTRAVYRAGQGRAVHGQERGYRRDLVAVATWPCARWSLRFAFRVERGGTLERARNQEMTVRKYMAAHSQERS